MKSPRSASKTARQRLSLVEPRERRLSLGDGFRVEVSIVVWEKPDVIRPDEKACSAHGACQCSRDGDVARAAPIKIGGERTAREASKALSRATRSGLAGGRLTDFLIGQGSEVR